MKQIQTADKGGFKWIIKQINIYLFYLACYLVWFSSWPWLGFFFITFLAQFSRLYTVTCKGIVEYFYICIISIITTTQEHRGFSNWEVYDQSNRARTAGRALARDVARDVSKNTTVNLAASWQKT